MGFINLIDRLLGREKAEASRNVAKDRLRLVLMHDRADIPGTMMEAIRTEMVAVLGKYVEFDTEALDVALEKDDGSIGLVLNIPIKRVKTEEEAAEAIAAAMGQAEAKDEEPEQETKVPAAKGGKKEKASAE